MLDNLGFALEGAWKVLTIGLLLGAGLPLVFALGIRSLAWGEGGTATGGHGTAVATPNPLGRPLAYLCFALVVLAIALGITVIVSSGLGKMVSFEHVYPTVVDKP